MNKSAARAVQILDYLASEERGGRPAGISEISRDLDMPKSSAFDCVYTLLELGFLRYAGEDRKAFALGTKTMQLGFSAMRQFDIVRLAGEELSGLHTRTGKTVFLCVERNGSLIVVDKTKEDGPVRFAAGIGSVLEFHLTAPGKAMLAAMTEDERIEIVGNGCFSTHTPNSIPNDFRLNKELRAIRQRGYATENYEDNNSTFAVAAPVYDYNNHVTAAVSVSLFRTEAEHENIDALAQEVMKTAVRISALMRSGKKETY